MLTTRDPIANLRIAAPCPTSWEGMAGDERRRHCTLCNLNVYNFAEMTRDEVRDLLVRTEGRVCARLYQRADGTVITRDCPTGLRALRRRASRIAAASFTALLSLPSLVFASPTLKKPRLKTRGAKVQLQIEKATTPRAARFHGVVRDTDGAPLPGVTVSVKDETSARVIEVVTDADGAFQIAAVNDGLYRVEVTRSGFKTARIEHLPLKASEVTHANVTLRLNATEMTIIVGAVAPDPMMNGPAMTFTQDFINKLPL